jgi:ADP-ribose pyrophosphatase
VYRGRIVDLGVDTVRFPDGSTGTLEMVRHVGASAILPVLDAVNADDPRVILVRQYRYAAGGVIWEVPAGMRDAADVDWRACAARELEEETGYRARRLEYLTRIHTTPGFTDEVIRLFLATDLEAGQVDRDIDEFMEVRPLPFSQALELVRDGEITDGKSVAVLLYAAAFVFGSGECGG